MVHWICECGKAFEDVQEYRKHRADAHQSATRLPHLRAGHD